MLGVGNNSEWAGLLENENSLKSTGRKSHMLILHTDSG